MKGVCAVCSAEFQRRQSQIEKWPANYCSQKCQHLALMKIVPVEQITALYCGGMTQRQIASVVGCGQQLISRTLQRAGVRCRVTSRVHNWMFPTDESAQPELAYWMGFSFADGCMEAGRSVAAERLSIRIQKRDRALLERLVMFIGATPAMIRNIRVTQAGVKTIRSEQVGLWLIQKGLRSFLRDWGVVPRKSYPDAFVRPQVTRALLPHFIRGWFDGDGYVRARAAGVGIVAHSAAAAYLAGALQSFGIGFVVEPRKSAPMMADVRLRLKESRQFYVLCNGYPRLERKWQRLDRRFAA